MPHPPLDLGALPSLDDIEFVERLGQGVGAGRFRARLAGDVDVALVIEDTTHLDRAAFAEWGHTLAALDHSSIPAVRRVEDVLEPGFVAFDYIDGHNLEARLALRGEGLPELDALAVTLQAAAAIRAAHRVGVAHGGLDARSVILVERAGGLDGAVVVGWSPPIDGERFEDRARADLKALGALLYIALTGVAPPSSQRLDVDGLDGGGGAFDDILMDWVDVERDLGGLGRPALDALADSGRFVDVAAFVDELLPAFRRTVEGHIEQSGRALEADRAFMEEVERQRGRLRELEMRAGALRDWLASHATRIERCDVELDTLKRRVAALESLETEMGLIAGRRSPRLSSRSARLESARDWESPPAPIDVGLPTRTTSGAFPARTTGGYAAVEPTPRTTGGYAAVEPAPRTTGGYAAVETAPEPPTTPERPQTSTGALPIAAEETPSEAPVSRAPEPPPPPIAPPPEPLDDLIAPSPPSRRGLGGATLVATLAGAVLLGVLGAAWLLADRGETPPPGKAPTVQQAGVAATESVTPTPAPVAPTPAPEQPSPVEADRVETFVEPVVVPDAGPPDAAPAPPPPEGMVHVPAAAVQPGLADPQRALARARCVRDLDGYPEAWCDERVGPTVEPVEAARAVGGFFIDVREVSQGRFRECIAAGACDLLKLTWDLDTQPATGVTRDMAAAYCTWRGGRLPTADEWLLAARGTDGRLYPWGDDDLGDGREARANHGRFTHKGGLPERSDRHKYAAPVEVFDDRGVSPYGAQNMAGNVKEWTADTTAEGEAVAMGGGWREAPFELRVTRREPLAPDTARNDLGLRCVVDVGEGR